MKYSTKQIKCILRVKDFINISNSLSKLYKELDDKELSLSYFNDKRVIYELYCASIYNLMDTIKKMEYIFGECKRYSEFSEFINKEYTAHDCNHYDKDNYKSNFYQIINTIRKQVNHYNRDEEDDNMLFQLYIDFNLIEELRIIMNDIFNEIYTQLNKDKVKDIILSKRQIIYSVDKVNENIDALERKNIESPSEIDKIFSKENKEAIRIAREWFNPNNLYNLLNDDGETMKKYDLMDNEMTTMYDRVSLYIEEKGTKQQKEVMSALNKLMNADVKTRNDYELVIDKFREEIKGISSNGSDMR